VQQVLPRFFKSHNFNSFQRQLNYFGFNKTSKDIIQYSLDLFHADAPDDILLMNIATLVTSRHKKVVRGTLQRKVPLLQQGKDRITIADKQVDQARS
jgi:hypothetical protein